MYVYIHVYIHIDGVRFEMCVCIIIYVCIHTSTCIRICVMHICIRVCFLKVEYKFFQRPTANGSLDDLNADIVRFEVCIYIFIYVCMHTCVYIRICVMHIYTCMFYVLCIYILICLL